MRERAEGGGVDVVLEVDRAPGAAAISAAIGSGPARPRLTAAATVPATGSTRPGSPTATSSAGAAVHVGDQRADGVGDGGGAARGRRAASGATTARSPSKATARVRGAADVDADDVPTPTASALHRAGREPGRHLALDDEEER